MEECEWTKYGRTASISFNSNKKQINYIVGNKPNINEFINETYKGNTQTIKDIVDSFNSIFEDDPNNMRYNAYTFNDNDYVYMHFSDLTVPKNVKPYQKIDTIGEENIQYQMPAYFIQYISFAMKTDLNILGINIPHPSWVDLIVHGAGFKFLNLARRYDQCMNIIVDNNNYVQTPHCLELYYS